MELSGTSLQARMVELGAGPPVLLLHGAPIPAGYMLPLARALAPHHRVLLPDLPGYGGTPPLAGPDLIEAGDRLVEDAVLAKGIRELSVIGYSLGGYRAFDIALRGRLQALAIAALGGFAHLEDEERAAESRLAAALRTGFDLREPAVGMMLSPAAAASRPDLVEAVRGWVAATTSQNLAAELDAVAACRDLRPRLRALGIPVVARVGSLDPACPPHLSRAIAEAAGGALEVVPGVAHGILHEDLEGTTRSLLAFLSSATART